MRQENEKNYYKQAPQNLIIGKAHISSTYWRMEIVWDVYMEEQCDGSGRITCSVYIFLIKEISLRLTSSCDKQRSFISKILFDRAFSRFRMRNVNIYTINIVSSTALLAVNDTDFSSKTTT